MFLSKFKTHRKAIETTNIKYSVIFILKKYRTNEKIVVNSISAINKLRGLKQCQVLNYSVYFGYFLNYLGPLQGIIFTTRRKYKNWKCLSN